jgi:DNA mismatch repair protein MutS
MEISKENFMKFNKSLLPKVILSCLLFSSFFAQSVIAEKSIYSKIAGHYLNIYAKPKEESITEKKEHKKLKYDFTIKEIPEYMKHKMTYELLEKQGDPKNNFHNTIYNEELWKDIELFCGPTLHTENNLFDNINYTQTTFGKVVFQRILAQPTTNINLLKNRQEVVKELVLNRRLFKKINNELEKFKNNEHMLFSLWGQERNIMNEQLHRMAYFKFPGLKQLFNKNTLALEASNFIEDALLYVTIGALLMTSARLVAASIAKLSGANVRKDTDGMPLYLVTTYFTIVRSCVAAWTINHILKLKSTLIKMFQSKLIGLSSCVKSLEEIYSSIKNNKILSQRIKLNHIKNLKNKTSQLKKLINMLHKNTFKGKPSVFSIRGRVLAAYKLAEEIKNELIPAFEELGLVDAYQSIATLYKKFENEKIEFCFPTYVKSNITSLEAKDFWFPTLLNNTKPKNIVPNTIQMCGNKHPNNMIITGPNMGGKSTILKGFVMAAIMAQTCGIAPGTSLTLTPFSKILTFLNVADNTALGISLFKANMIRAKAMVDATNALPKGEHGLFVKDEPLNGTEPSKTIQGVAYLAGIFAKKRNCISMMSTHFRLLTELEEITKGEYVNYRVAITRNPDGAFTYPYKLEPGINQHDIALELMKQEGFTDEYGLKLSEMLRQRLNF